MATSGVCVVLRAVLASFFLWQQHVIHSIWRIYLASDMHAKKKLSKLHIRQTKAQIIIFWAKRKTISILSGIFPNANQLKQVQTKWRTVSELYQKKYQCWYVFFVQAPKRTNFTFLATTETCVHLILKPFFGIWRLCLLT